MEGVRDLSMLVSDARWKLVWAKNRKKGVTHIEDRTIWPGLLQDTQFMSVVLEAGINGKDK